ncbi:MAG: BspA family leucine-rich repeat surface protein [Enterococcus sp.]|nr:BspA family leucine-rich repeat surface protein [Enterococcus sp.]
MTLSSCAIFNPYETVNSDNKNKGCAYYLTTDVGEYKAKTLYFFGHEVSSLEEAVQNGSTYKYSWVDRAGNSGFSSRFAEAKDNCQTVTFDESSKEVKPTTCAFWFYEFSSLRSIQGIRNLDTSEVISMEWMFYGCSSLTNIDLSGFNTSNVKNIFHMFEKCSSLTSLDFSSFDTFNVKNMSCMFQDCSSLTSLNISNFDTSKVTHMLFMFFNCSNLTSLDLSNFDTSNVIQMGGMFQMSNSSNKLKTIYVSEKFIVCQDAETDNMFNRCNSLIGGAGTAFDSSHIDRLGACIDQQGGKQWGVNKGYFTEK